MWPFKEEKIPEMEESDIMTIEVGLRNGRKVVICQCSEIDVDELLYAIDNKHPSDKTVSVGTTTILISEIVYFQYYRIWKVKEDVAVQDEG